MDLSHVYKGSLIKVIGDLCKLVPREQFDAVVKKYIPEGLDGIEKFQYEPVKRESKDSGKTGKKQRIFDITKYRRRHIALRVFYDGSHMSGFAQRDSAQLLEGVADDNSVETAIFAALKRVHLIDDITKCHYQRCGRTDAGVSAFNQVISLYLRSNLRSGVEFVDEFDPTISYHAPENAVSSAAEFDYPSVLNKVLPPNIRVTGWCPVDRTFSARFSCCGRVYRYYFLRRQYDTELMRQAVKQLEGEHDFRNFCRIDAVNVCDFTRTIFHGDVIDIAKGDVPEHDVLAVEIVGRAFLWHQIRCIMSILFLVASKKEEISVIPKLLDVANNPCKPQYHLAAPEPLVLYDCIFNPGESACDTQTARYYKQIRSHALYSPLAESSKAKYNDAPCCFDNSLSQQALQDLIRYNETRIYDTAIASTSASQLSRVIQKEYWKRLEGISALPGDFEELAGKRYTPLGKRSKAPSYEDRIRSMGTNSLRKLQTRYQYADLEKNEFIPDVIKEPCS